MITFAELKKLYLNSLNLRIGQEFGFVELWNHIYSDPKIYRAYVDNECIDKTGRLISAYHSIIDSEQMEYLSSASEFGVIDSINQSFIDLIKSGRRYRINDIEFVGESKYGDADLLINITGVRTKKDGTLGVAKSNFVTIYVK